MGFTKKWTKCGIGGRENKEIRRPRFFYYDFATNNIKIGTRKTAQKIEKFHLEKKIFTNPWPKRESRVIVINDEIYKFRNKFELEHSLLNAMI